MTTTSRLHWCQDGVAGLGTVRAVVEAVAPPSRREHCEGVEARVRVRVDGDGHPADDRAVDDT